MSKKTEFDKLANLYTTEVLNEGLGSMLGGAGGTIAGAMSPIPGGALLGGIGGTLAGAAGDYASKDDDEEDHSKTDEMEVTLDKAIAKKILDALESALSDETSEDAEGFMNAAGDTIKKGAYAGAGSLGGQFIGNAIGGPLGGIAGSIIGGGLGARAAK
jgi:hypothetical protein